MFIFFGVVSVASARECTFCGLDSTGHAHTFDLSSLPNKTFALSDARGGFGMSYLVTTPCGNAYSAQCGAQASPMLQSCKGVGSLADR